MVKVAIFKTNWMLFIFWDRRSSYNSFRGVFEMLDEARPNKPNPYVRILQIRSNSFKNGKSPFLTIQLLPKLGFDHQTPQQVLFGHQTIKTVQIGH
jgi:hypothetical protein